MIHDYNACARYKFSPNIEFRVPYSKGYLFNAIPDTNHNANPTNPNRNSKSNPNTTNRNTKYHCEWHPKLNVCPIFFFLLLLKAKDSWR